MKPTIKPIPLTELTLAKKFQPREALDKNALGDYTDLAKKAKAAGAEVPWPPLKAVRRDGELFVYSGFTRAAACKAAGIEEVKVEVEDNDLITDTEILIKAIAANQENGVRLTSADKLRNLLHLIKEEPYASMSNNALAPIIGASEHFLRLNRPAAAKPSTVTAVTKTGKTHKVKTAGIGKKGGKKPKAPKATKKSSAATPDEPKGLNQEADRALTRICNVVNGHAGLVGSKIKEAVLSGALPLTESDLTLLAKTNDSRILQATPLVVEKGWKPRQAFSFLDKEVDSSTKVDHLVNLAIAGGGIASEKVIDSNGYIVVCFNSKTHEVEEKVKS